MSELIQTNEIEGFKVYGQQMVDYTVDGVSHSGYSYTIALAALANTSSMERAVNGMAAMFRARQKKLEELGTALAVITKAIESMDKEDQTSGDKSSSDAALQTAKETLAKYDIKLNVDGNNKVRRDDASYAKNDVQYSMDNENNDLQQDMVTFQNLMSKRDNAFSSASKLMKKADSTTSSIIRSI